jgi:hypothetical protein
MSVQSHTNSTNRQRRMSFDNPVYAVQTTIRITLWTINQIVKSRDRLAVNRVCGGTRNDLASVIGAVS